MDNENSNSHLLNLINLFISGNNCSLQIAGEIEVLLDELFPNDEYMQDVIVMLASYQPSGGEYLYDEEHLQNKLIHVKNELLLASKLG